MGDARGHRGSGPREHPPRLWLAVLALSGGLFLSVLSTTVVSVALPSIGRDLHASHTELEWIVDAYVLVYASLLVVGRVVGDRWGRKGAFLGGVAIFGLGAALTGLAPNIPLLLAGRVVQGVGPALLVPVSLTIIRAIVEDPRRRAVAIGVWSTGSGLALAIGPVLGGAAVDMLGWRWVFLLNLPLTAALLALAGLTVPRLAPAPAAGRIDGLGAVLTTAGAAALAFACIEGQSLGWTAPLVLAALGAGAVAIAAFVGWERRHRNPLVDMRLFGSQPFTIANVAALVVFFAFVGSIVYFSAFFQQVQGRSPVTAGLNVCAIGVAFALAAQLSGRLVARYGARLPTTTGLILSGGAMLGLLRLQPSTGASAIWWNFALLGAGIGLCLAPTSATVVAAVDAERAGMASAVHTAVRQLGQVFGVAVLGALVYARLPAAGSGERYDPAQQRLFVAGLHNATLICGLALLAAAALATLLPATASTPDNQVIRLPDQRPVPATQLVHNGPLVPRVPPALGVSPALAWPARPTDRRYYTKTSA